MKKIIATIALTLGLLPAQAQSEDIVYTKVGIYAEKGKSFATNYAAGTCYPANSKFLVLKTSSDEMDVVDMKSNQKFRIVNVPKYTKKTMTTLRDSIFSSIELDLSKHSAPVLEAIKNCQVKEGMTRDEVILARGYPPAHKTPSLEGDAWRYWRKRLDTGVVHFEKNKVVRIEERVD